MMKMRLYDANKVVPKKSGHYLAIFECHATTTWYDAAQRGWNIHSSDRKTEMFPLYWIDHSMKGNELKEGTHGNK